MPSIVSLKTGGKGYTKVAFVQSHDSNFLFYIEVYFHHRDMTIQETESIRYFQCKYPVFHF